MKKNRRSPLSESTGSTPAPGADSRRLSTKERLIDVGERLFGHHGFDGISLREIASAAGQGNSNVVQYHFADKAGLIQAILEDRVVRIEQVRCMQLAMLDAATPLNPRQLLKVLWLPLMAIKDGDGTHSFCRFMLQYMLHPNLTNHPLAPFYHFPLNPEVDEDIRLPCGKRAAQLLFSLYPGLSNTLVQARISTLATMFLASVVEHDNARGVGGVRQDFSIEPILDMAVPALAAPAG